jgi:hypothetical protein
VDCGEGADRHGNKPYPLTAALAKRSAAGYNASGRLREIVHPSTKHLALALTRRGFSLPRISRDYFRLGCVVMTRRPAPLSNGVAVGGPRVRCGRGALSFRRILPPRPLPDGTGAAGDGRARLTVTLCGGMMGSVVESRGGISPPRAPKTVREPLDSHGSRCSAVSMT